MNKHTGYYEPMVLAAQAPMRIGEVCRNLITPWGSVSQPCMVMRQATGAEFERSAAERGSHSTAKHAICAGFPHFYEVHTD